MPGFLGTNFVVIIHFFLLSTLWFLLTNSFFLRLLVIIIRIDYLISASLNHCLALRSCLIIFILILLFGFGKFCGSLYYTLSFVLRNNIFPTHITVTKISDLELF